MSNSIAPDPIKIMVVDDHKILAESMTTLLNDQDGMEVVSQAHSGNEAINYLKDHNQELDLVILDLQMEETENNELAGFKVARHILDNLFVKDVNEIRILIMSQYQEGYMIDLAHKMGIHGFLAKDCASQELFDAIKYLAHKKRRYYRGKIQEIWDDFSYENTGQQTMPKLTSTESEILQLIAQGLITKEIADIRNRGVDGIEAHRRNIMRKFNANNAPHMIALAYKWGMIK